MIQVGRPLRPRFCSVSYLLLLTKAKSALFLLFVFLSERPTYAEKTYFGESSTALTFTRQQCILLQVMHE
jgi:hypothetical protein